MNCSRGITSQPIWGRIWVRRAMDWALQALERISNVKKSNIEIILMHAWHIAFTRTTQLHATVSQVPSALLCLFPMCWQLSQLDSSWRKLHSSSRIWTRQARWLQVSCSLAVRGPSISNFHPDAIRSRFRTRRLERETGNRRR